MTPVAATAADNSDKAEVIISLYDKHTWCRIIMELISMIQSCVQGSNIDTFVK